MKLSVVIPVCNERDNLVPLHYALTEVLSGLNLTYELLFVDDGSRDCSLNVLERLAEQDPAVKVIEFARNFGQTAALDAGLRLAAGEAVVTLDADLQNDPADIPRMLERLAEGYDLVYGWRRHRQDGFATRLLPSRVANWIIRRVTGFPANDIGCTLKVMRRETAQQLRLYGELHRFIPILAHAQGARCAEQVVRHHPRRFGATKYGLGRTVRVACDLLLVYFLTRYAASPLRLFSRIAALGLAASAAACVGAVAMHFLAEVPLAGNVLWAVAAVGLIGAMQACGLGLLAEVAARAWFEGADRRPYSIRSTRNWEAPGRASEDAESLSEFHRWPIAERQSA